MCNISQRSKCRGLPVFSKRKRKLVNFLLFVDKKMKTWHFPFFVEWHLQILEKKMMAKLSHINSINMMKRTDFYIKSIARQRACKFIRLLHSFVSCYPLNVFQILTSCIYFSKQINVPLKFWIITVPVVLFRFEGATGTMGIITLLQGSIRYGDNSPATDET